MYAIARYLTKDARRATVRAFADGTPDDDDEYGPYCPLGYALERMGTPARWSFNQKNVPAPMAYQVAMALLPSLGPAAYNDICAAARRFIERWDDGKITDLARAFGVKGD